MKKITMEDFPVKAKDDTSFILLNENARIELQPDSFSMSSRCFSKRVQITCVFIRRDLRKLLEPYAGQAFTVCEMKNGKEYHYYQNVTMDTPSFSVDADKDFYTNLYLFN